MNKKIGLVVFVVLAINFIGCNSDDGSVYDPCRITRQRVGLGLTYTITDMQVYDDANRSQIWEGNIPSLHLGRFENDIGSVENGKLTATLLTFSDHFAVSNSHDPYLVVRHNPNNVQIRLVWALDYWPDGLPNGQSVEGLDRRRLRFRNMSPGDNVHWILIYADRAGIVGATFNDFTFDFDLAQGWNAARQTINNPSRYVTHPGFGDASAYYDSVHLHN